MTAKPIYKRVLLKASGEALMGSQGFGIDVAVADRIASDIAEARALGVEVGVVVGGGNIFRGVAVASKGGDRVTSTPSSSRRSPCRRSARASPSARRFITSRSAVW
jgi:hypothetical protein